MTGRLLHLGQVVVDLTLRIERLPERGGDVFADRSGMSAGGGFNLLFAARRFGARAVHLGGMGQGGMADVAATALRTIDVPCEGPVVPHVDQGYSVAMTEADGERTFVSTRGAETMLDARSFAHLDVTPEDIVSVSGYSFSHTGTTAAVRGFLQSDAARVATCVFDPGPMVADIEARDLALLRDRARVIWSVNEREAGILVERLDIDEGASDGGEVHAGGAVPAAHAGERAGLLSRALGAVVIVRVGPAGAWLAVDGAAVHVPSIPVRAVDTNGAGDAHTGVLAASLLEGLELERAVRLANCAGALSTTNEGPATAPTREELLVAADGPVDRG